MKELTGKLNAELEQMAEALSLPGASILLARIERAEHVDALADELKRRLSRFNLSVEIWQFSPENLNLPGYLLSLANGERRVVFALGLEKLDPQTRREAYRILNLGREKIGRSRCGLVLWLPGQAIEELFRHAPDFWAWVQSVHPLALPDEELEKERVLTGLRLWEAENLENLRLRYLEYIVNSYRWLDFQGIMQVRNIVRFPLDRIFVPLMGVERRPRIEKAEVRELRTGIEEPTSSPLEGKPYPFPFEERPIPLEEAWKKHRLLVILGDPGSGKSTFLKHLALSFALNRQEEERFPILISISEYAFAKSRGETADILEFIAGRFREQGLPDLMPLFVSELEKGRAIVLLDGLDEVLSSADRKDIAREIEDLARRYPLSRFIVTSRIAGYASAPLSSEFTVLTLAPFSREEIKTFAHNWARAYEAITMNYSPGREGWPPFPPEIENRIHKRAEDLFRAITDHPATERLAANPLLLTILALIHQQGTRLPQQRVELYRLCIEALAETWNLARSLSGRPIELWLGERRLDAGEVVRVLGPVAFWMQENRPGGLIEREKLEELIAGRLLEAGLAREKAEAHKRAVEFVDLMREQMGLMVERGPGQFGFMHLSFQEYLAARYTVDRGNPFEVLKPHLFDPRWREVVLLTAAVLGSTSSGWATSFLERVYKADAPYDDILHWPLLLSTRILADDVPVDMGLALSILKGFCRLIALPYDKIRQEMGSILKMLGPTRYGASTGQILSEALRDGNSQVRRNAAWALVNLGKPEPYVLDALIKALKDENSLVRANAAWALGNLGKPEPYVLDALIEALKDENSLVRENAAEALGKLSKPEPYVLDALIKALKDENSRVRENAAWALGNLGKPEPYVLDALIKALKDENSRVRENAAEALGKLSKPEPYVLDAFIKALKDKDSWVRVNIALALVNLGKTEPYVLDALIKALKDEDSRVRAIAAWALGKLGKPEPYVLDALIKALKDEDSEVRAIAAEALSKLKLPPPIAKEACEAIAMALKSEGLDTVVMTGLRLAPAYDIIFEALWSLAEEMVKAG